MAAVEKKIRDLHLDTFDIPVDLCTNDEIVEWKGIQMAPHSFNLWKYIQKAYMEVKRLHAEKKPAKQLEKSLDLAVKDFLVHSLEKFDEPITLQLVMPDQGLVLNVPVKRF